MTHQDTAHDMIMYSPLRTKSLYLDKAIDDEIVYVRDPITGRERTNYFDTRRMPAMRAYRLEELLNDLATRKRVAIPTTRLGNTGLFVIDKAKPLGAICPLIHEALSSCIDGYEYSPHLKAMYRLARDTDYQFMIGSAMTNKASMWDSTNADHLRTCTKFLNSLREIYRSRSFKRTLKNRADNAQRNYRSMLLNVHRQLVLHSHIVGIRVDLYLASEIGCINEGRYTPGKHFHFLEEVIEITRLRDDFVRHLRTHPMFNGCLHWILKLEFSESRGPHIHAFFFFDNKVVKSDYHWATKIGHLWMSIAGIGSNFHNCARDRSKYKNCCIGTIHRDDLSAMKGLEFALQYLAKTDQYFRIKTSAKMRTLSQKIWNRNFRRGSNQNSPAGRVELMEDITPAAYPKVPIDLLDYKPPRERRRASKSLLADINPDTGPQNLAMLDAEHRFSEERKAWVASETNARVARRATAGSRNSQSQLLNTLNNKIRPSLRSSTENMVDIDSGTSATPNATRPDE